MAFLAPLDKAVKAAGKRKNSAPGKAMVRAKQLKHTGDELEVVKRAPTDQQRRFARYIAMGDSPSNAAIRAGYAGATICDRLKKMPHVAALIKEEQAKFEADNQMTRRKVMDGFIEAIDMAKMIGEPGNMIAGWREIAKMCGYFAPVEKKLVVTDESGATIMDRLGKLSDAELLKLIHDDPDVIDVEATEVSDDE